MFLDPGILEVRNGAQARAAGSVYRSQGKQAACHDRSIRWVADGETLPDDRAARQPWWGTRRKGYLDRNLGQDVSSEGIKEHPGHLSWWPKPEP